ncbi:MAG: GspH/FimT family pseudopilin [Luteimonas sp.]|nr:GspH/FimT family pseudopilin [Luteimonas sp.]
MKRKDAGYSLIEAMTVLAILALTLTLGLSNFGGSLRRNRTQATMHLLSADMAMARNTAIMRGVAVVVCPRTTDGGCGGDSDWSRGWIVFADGDGNRRPDPGQALLRSEDAPAAGDGSMRVVSSRPWLRYQPDGRSANSNLTVHVCVDGKISGQVKVNNLGRIRTSTQDAGSPCPR